MPLKKFKDLSISKKLFIIVGTMAVLIAIELITLGFAINTLSAVRATVGAEGLYSKAQKDAIFALAKYARTHDIKDFQKYEGFMKVPLGDRKTRLELIKATPDYDAATNGFREGRVHEQDIDGVIKLLRRFSNNKYIASAITEWTKGDSLISILLPLGDSIHQEILTGNASAEKLEGYLSNIEKTNDQLTTLEDNFSFTLGEGSRWLENFILKLLLSVAITVEITGLALTIMVSRSMTRELNDIVDTTNKISIGDLSARAKIYSKDEIGQVAEAVNEMTEKLTNSNRELSEFAHIASHDLQEPLRTISNYNSLLEKQYSAVLDENGRKYLASMALATTRMQGLIKDLLEYAEIGKMGSKSQVDCNEILQTILLDMDAVLKENNIDIQYHNLPTIYAFPVISQLFQNLISNAVKFRNNNVRGIIEINAIDKNGAWVFSIKDNGIGIEAAYQERIFTIFQRLHSRKEYPGSGIGLAQSRKIAELHGGKIWVESEKDKGSIFYFTIPKLNE